MNPHKTHLEAEQWGDGGMGVAICDADCPAEHPHHRHDTWEEHNGGGWVRSVLNLDRLNHG